MDWEASECEVAVNFGAVVRLAVIGFFAFFLNPTMPIWVPIVVFFIGGFYTAMAGSLYHCGSSDHFVGKARQRDIGTFSMGQNLGPRPQPVFMASL